MQTIDIKISWLPSYCYSEGISPSTKIKTNTGTTSPVPLLWLHSINYFVVQEANQSIQCGAPFSLRCHQMETFLFLCLLVASANEERLHSSLTETLLLLLASSLCEIIMPRTKKGEIECHRMKWNCFHWILSLFRLLTEMNVFVQLLPKKSGAFLPVCGGGAHGAL